MTVDKALAFLSTHGLDLAQFAFEHEVEDLGLEQADARLYRAIGAVYFGPCSEQTRRTEAINLAQHFPIARLAIIHKAASQLHKSASISRWELRLELTKLTHLSLTELRQHAVDRVRQLNASTGKPAPRSLIIGRRTDATGRRTAVFKLPEKEMAWFEGKLRRLTRTRGSVPEDIAMGNACFSLLGNKPGHAKESSSLEPTVLVKTDDFRRHSETTLQATDATTVNAAEYLNGRLGEYGWAILYDQNAQPVNLWRTRRLANQKQRAIIAADQGQCAWPGCERIALYGQAHHIVSWENGGETNLDNLLGLCGPHNAQNGRGANGHMERDKQGRPVWIPPDGKNPLYNQGIHTLRSGRSWALG